MNTLVIEKPIRFKRRKFIDLYDLSKCILENMDEVELFEAKKEDLTDEIIKLSYKCREMSRQEFVNI
jgi:hypothetical protein